MFYLRGARPLPPTYTRKMSKQHKINEINRRIEGVLMELSINEEQAYRLHDLLKEKEDIELEEI